MPQESLVERKARSLEILKRLRDTYPEAHCELEFSNPLELLVATILSAQCSDRQVNRVTANLFVKYKTANDYAIASLETLEDDLKQIGLFRNKARHIRSCCQSLVEHHQGEVPASLESLIALDGVGRKTANVVMGNAFQLTTGIVVDTHVARLAFRMGLSKETDAKKIEQDLQGLFPKSEWIWISHGLIWHGRRRCHARKPECGLCELRQLCPALDRPEKTSKGKLKGKSPLAC